MRDAGVDWFRGQYGNGPSRSPALSVPANDYAQRRRERPTSSNLGQNLTFKLTPAVRWNALLDELLLIDPDAVLIHSITFQAL